MVIYYFIGEIINSASNSSEWFGRPAILWKEKNLRRGLRFSDDFRGNRS